MFDTHAHHLHASRKDKGRALAWLFVLLITLVFAAHTARAQSTTFMYQGRLTDAGANANGTYDLEFKLFDAAGGQSGPTLTRDDVQVTDGLFTVPLDFGLSPFAAGTAFTLGIGVRPGASSGAFNALAPRQPLTSSPYAIQTINAAQLGGVPASEYVKTDDPRLNSSGGQPAPGSNNYIQNSATTQANASFNIGGNGLVGGNVGIGAPPDPGIRLQIDGNTQMFTGAAGNRYRLNFGSPNSETGMTLIKPETGTPTGRADLRYDGSTLKLVAGTGGIPPPTNGLAITNAGNVGIGTTSPQTKLEVVGNSGNFAMRVQGSNSSSIMSIQNTDPTQGGALSVSGAAVGLDATGRGSAINASSPNIAVSAFSQTGYAIYGKSPNGYAGRFNGIVAIYGELQFETGALPTGGTQPLCLNGTYYVSSCNSSSLRYKTDLRAFTGGLSIVNRLRPISYRWKADGTADLGFGAEDVAKVEPLFTFRNSQGEIEGVRYDRLSVVFVNAIREQQAQIERQQQQLDELKQLLLLRTQPARRQTRRRR